MMTVETTLVKGARHSAPDLAPSFKDDEGMTIDGFAGERERSSEPSFKVGFHRAHSVPDTTRILAAQKMPTETFRGFESLIRAVE